MALANVNANHIWFDLLYFSLFVPPTFLSYLLVLHLDFQPLAFFYCIYFHFKNE